MAYITVVHRESETRKCQLDQSFYVSYDDKLIQCMRCYSLCSKCTDGGASNCKACIDPTRLHFNPSLSSCEFVIGPVVSHALALDYNRLRIDSSILDSLLDSISQRVDHNDL